jgi:hypothetical protein
MRLVLLKICVGFIAYLLRGRLAFSSWWFVRDRTLQNVVACLEVSGSRRIAEQTATS